MSARDKGRFGWACLGLSIVAVSTMFYGACQIDNKHGTPPPAQRWEIAR